MTAHIPAYGIRIEQEWMVCPWFFVIAVVILQSQNVHPSTGAYIAEPCLFYVLLFITNYITAALSDLNWTEVLARAEQCVENHTVRFLFHP